MKQFFKYLVYIVHLQNFTPNDIDTLNLRHNKSVI